MPNQDYPGVCLACVDEECKVTPPDISIARERVRKLPEGYTLTMVRSLQWAFPDKFSSLEEAYMAIDAMKAVIVNVLKIHGIVDLEGIGEWRTEPDNGRKKIVFTPERALLDGVNE